jgi:hypothetical protein
MLYRRRKLILPFVALAGIGLALAGCFKNPTDPNLGAGGGAPGGVPNNASDRTTTGISALASQANGNGVYLSVVNQTGSALGSTGFAGASFQVTYNGTVIPAGSIRLNTASGAGQSISTALTLDYSGSMSSTSLTNMETAATAFVNNMQAADRGEIIKFDTNILLMQSFTSDKDALRAAITRAASLGGSTALFDSVYMGVTHTAGETGQRAVVAFTDGGENSSVIMTSLGQLTTEARNRGVPIYTVGLGSADTTTLQTMASQTGGRFYLAPDSAQLAQIYQQIAQIFNNTIILSWPSFTYQSGAVINITVTYVCANGTFTSTASITLP